MWLIYISKNGEKNSKIHIFFIFWKENLKVVKIHKENTSYDTKKYF
jgi:hypothetical protein